MQTATTSFGLIERAQRGDQRAFELLFEKYRRRLAVLIYYRLGPRLREQFEIDDILQETLLKAFSDIGRFQYQSAGSFLRWLSRIADHVVADLGRSQGRQKRQAVEIVRFRSESNAGGPEPADTKTPSRLLSQKEGVAALLDALNALPPDYRRVILLAKIEGLSTAELADQLGKSRQAAALLLHRAIRRFGEIYGRDDGDHNV